MRRWNVVAECSRHMRTLRDGCCCGMGFDVGCYAMTPEQLNELRQRNERRAAKARDALGTKWLMHPSNRVKRKPVDLGVLGGMR